MALRWSGHMHGERFLANTSPSKMEVHDLQNEKAAPNGCQIDEIIKAGNDHHYTSLGKAIADGYDPCAKCLPGSRR